MGHGTRGTRDCENMGLGFVFGSKIPLARKSQSSHIKFKLFTRGPDDKNSKKENNKCPMTGLKPSTFTWHTGKIGLYIISVTL